MARYAYVISPLSDKIRLVVASGGGPMLKYIVTEDDFRYVTTTMNKGEQLTYVLILANANKRGIQKLELAYERKCCVQLCGFTSLAVVLTQGFHVPRDALSYLPSIDSRLVNHLV